MLCLWAIWVTKAMWMAWLRAVTAAHGQPVDLLAVAGRDLDGRGAVAGREPVGGGESGDVGDVDDQVTDSSAKLVWHRSRPMAPHEG